jgi:GNAT superfamily N-acetyltransferase
MDQFRLRRMEPADRAEVADLICISTNYWYRIHGGSDIFPGPAAAEIFFDVYQALDPGCGVVAENQRTGRLMGSCFVHPRQTHVSLGIMNAHPNYFGSGVARALLKHILDFADSRNQPVRLVSSAMNLDSFSLYTRAGFVPRRAYQDMWLAVPETGVTGQERFAPGGLPAAIREATLDDVPAIADLEMALCGIRREIDFRCFVENRDGIWHVSVCRANNGRLDGFMASCSHPGCNMIGPGLARTPELAAQLLLAELDRHRGRRPVFLVPVDCEPLVREVYRWGARNCEMHFSQVRGGDARFDGVNMPTFLPESA